MTVVLVHGNPETDAVWGRWSGSSAGRESTTLSGSHATEDHFTGTEEMRRRAAARAGARVAE